MANDPKKSPQKSKKPDFHEDIHGGPLVGTSQVRSKKSAAGNIRKSSRVHIPLRKRIMLKIIQAFSNDSTLIFKMIMAGLVLISLGVIVKGFLCPDLAAVQNSSWYCHLQ